MYNFRQCTYEEFRQIVSQYSFESCPWELIDPAYIDGLEAVESQEGEIVALIYYDPCRNENCELLIMQFEVRKDLRRMGYGSRIISQFLSAHKTSMELLPFGDDAVCFWQSCGFEGDSFGLYYYPDEQTENELNVVRREWKE